MTEIVRRSRPAPCPTGPCPRRRKTLAQAMNLIGMSNCGEGGEDPARYRTRGRGRDDKNSKIKQIASGRFGSRPPTWRTPTSCRSRSRRAPSRARAPAPGPQGVARDRPPAPHPARRRPHLAAAPRHLLDRGPGQLIYDLKQVNAAQVSVKLVAEEGVGTIAAGCVKALADVVHISGQNGGTGASPLSSIKHAGMPWELGLADAQRSLVDNDLRSRVRLRVDGGFLTGRQVIVAALLGADEFSFGTAAMIAEGCIMLRLPPRHVQAGRRHPAPHLRANFTGTPEGVAALPVHGRGGAGLPGRAGPPQLDEAVGRSTCCASAPPGSSGPTPWT